MNMNVHRLGNAKDNSYSIFISFQHLSQSHIMPRTLPVVVIILAACMGLPQHWGLVLTTALLVAAFAVLLNSAIFLSLQTILWLINIGFPKTLYFNHIGGKVKRILMKQEKAFAMKTQMTQQGQQNSRGAFNAKTRNSFINRDRFYTRFLCRSLCLRAPVADLSL
jgi:hypothetical protein